MDGRYIKFYIPKKDGSKREILAPKEELKQKQKEFLLKLYKTRIFDHIYSRSFGFIPKRNIVKNAKYHAGKKFLLKVDIKDFFPSCKYRYDIVHLLSELTEMKKEKIIDLIYYKNGEDIYEWFLPQGAPTSPFISNLYLSGFDKVLVTISRTQFSNDIVYTRYADDLCISSNSKCIFSPKYLNIIETCLSTYGYRMFVLNREKIKKLTPGVRKKVTGIIVTSEEPTISRQERKKYKAWIYNIINARCQFTKQDIYHILGKLAFFEQVPKHKEWVQTQRKILLNFIGGKI